MLIYNRRKWQKLKEVVKTEHGTVASGEAPKTPAKRGSKKGDGESVKKSTSKRKKTEAGHAVDDGNEDDEEVSPSKKKVKAEQGEDELA